MNIKTDVTLKVGTADIVLTVPQASIFSISDAHCVMCGDKFTRDGGIWTDICPGCSRCHECGSEMLVYHKTEHFIRCLKCLHGREVSSV